MASAPPAPCRRPLPLRSQCAAAAAAGGDALTAVPPLAPLPPPLPTYALPPHVSPTLITRPADVRDAAALLAAAPVVGMDCEWGPDPPGGGRPRRGGRPARYAPVETLQLATADAAFVIDLRALRSVGGGRGGGGGGGGAGADDDDDAAEALDGLLSALFTPPAPLLAGHSLRGDLARLAATLPRLRVFGGGGGGRGGGGGGRPAPLAGHVDLVLLSRAAAAGSGAAAAPSAALASAWPAPSLAKLTAAALRAHLDKAPRRSDWTARPLSPTQLAYAAADAHVCVRLFDALAGARAWGGGGGGGGGADLAASPAWLAFLANRVKDAAGGRGGGGAAPACARPAAGPGSGLGRRERLRARAEEGGGGGGGLARPARPAPPPPRHAAAGTPPPRLPPARETAVDVDALLDRFLGVPLPAGGRPAVVAAAAGLLAPGAGPADAASALRAAPPAPRGGVLEFANAAALLVNFTAASATADRGPPRLYANRFFPCEPGHGGGGVAMSWWPSPGQGRQSRLTARLLGPAGDGAGSDTVLLFARLTGGRKTAYTLLGRLEAARVDWGAAHGGGEVAWRLLDVGDAARRGGRAVAALLEAGGWEAGGGLP